MKSNKRKAPIQDPIVMVGEKLKSGELQITYLVILLICQSSFCTFKHLRDGGADFRPYLHYTGIFRYIILSKEPDSRAMEVLQFQLERYEEVLRDDSLKIKKIENTEKSKEKCLRQTTG